MSEILVTRLGESCAHSSVVFGTRRGESWAHSSVVFGTRHILQRLTKNALVGLMTFFVGTHQILLYKYL